VENEKSSEDESDMSDEDQGIDENNDPEVDYSTGGYDELVSRAAKAYDSTKLQVKSVIFFHLKLDKDDE
jgi:hypothetical protein